MLWPRRLKPVQPPKPSGSWRNRLAVLLALVTLVCLVSAFSLSKGTQLLMPGPLTSGHGVIENCSACHTKSGNNKLSWLHGLVAADPLADSKGCLTCHKMPDTAFNPHGASTEVLEQSTKRLTKIAAGATAPHSARAQGIAFPMEDAIKGGLYCATCHQEHQGINFNLNRISNEQCRSCHVMKFDSFDGHHPKFVNYPFERRTRIIYDHAGHFSKHYPDVAKKDPAKRVPATCSTCHNSSADKRVMALVPFDQTCSACHLDQIIGKERVSGPKGIAFLALPGLDLQTLKQRNAPIGEWPEASDAAALTPFMKVMIGRTEQGRTMVKAVDNLNLQDLSEASDDQIKVVTNLVWEIKGLFYALIKEKASDVLGDLSIGGGVKLGPTLIADLTSSLPRDVVISAQQEWLPNLPAEMTKGPDASDQEQSSATESRSTGPVPPAELPESDAPQAIPTPIPQGTESEAAAEETETAEAATEIAEETTCTDEVPRAEEEPQDKDAVSEIEVADVAPDAPSAEENSLVTIKGRLPLPTGTPRAIKARIEDAEKRAVGETDVAKVESDGGKVTRCAEEQPRAKEEIQAEVAASEIGTAGAKPDGGNEAPSTDEQPSDKVTEQFDDLLFPTEEELRGAKASVNGAEKTGQPEEEDTASKADDIAPATAQPDANTLATQPQTLAQPVISVESDVDPENWAEYGGWYRQDYAIFYRPTGHKDKFIHSWLSLTGPQAPKGDTTPAAAVFDFLTNKDAQGSCMKCHSVDDIRGQRRLVNFSPLSVASKQGRFTNFIHEPHFGVIGDRGCLACHSLEKGRPYLKSYEQGNPRKFVPGFGAVNKELCQTCHASGKARQDCLLCHKYHVNGATTPIMNTKIPVQ